MHRASVGRISRRLGETPESPHRLLSVWAQAGIGVFPFPLFVSWLSVQVAPQGTVMRGPVATKRVQMASFRLWRPNHTRRTSMDPQTPFCPKTWFKSGGSALTVSNARWPVFRFQDGENTSTPNRRLSSRFEPCLTPSVAPGGRPGRAIAVCIARANGAIAVRPVGAPSPPPPVRPSIG